jgi:hypothetical protein
VCLAACFAVSVSMSSVPGAYRYDVGSTIPGTVYLKVILVILIKEMS